MKTDLASLHSEVYNAIKASDVVTVYSANVYDGLPNQLLKGTGYPIVIVNSPTSSTALKTLGASNWSADIYINIEIFTKKQSLAREIADAVNTVLSTTSFSTAEFYGISSSSETVEIRGQRGRQYKEWHYAISYKFVGVGSWQ